MSRNTLTGLIILGLLILSGLASAILPSLRGGEESGGSNVGESLNPGFGIPDFDTTAETITLPDFPAEIPVISPLLFDRLSGLEVNELVLFLVLTVLVVGITIGAGLPLVFIYTSLDKVSASNKENEGYQSGMAQLQKRNKEFVSHYKKEQPPTPIPSHERHQWSAISTTMVTMVLLAFLGGAISDNFYAGENIVLWAVGLAAIGLIAGLMFFRSGAMQESAESERADVNWGSLFVVLTGVLVVGLGLGIMMWVRSAV